MCHPLTGSVLHFLCVFLCVVVFVNYHVTSPNETHTSKRRDKMGAKPAKLTDEPGGFPWSMIPPRENVSGMARSGRVIAQQVRLSGMAKAEGVSE